MKHFLDLGSQTRHLKTLCKELGIHYSIVSIDGEWVIYRDFGNGFNVEISGVNYNSVTKKATIYLWYGHSFVVFRYKDVFQCDISYKVEELCCLSQELVTKHGNDESSLRSLAAEYCKNHYEHI